VFRPTDEPLDELLAASHGVRCRASLWRGDVFLGEAPVTGGELTEAADQFVGMTLDLSVSSVDEVGRSWLPTSPLDPLNTFGQRAYVQYEVRRASGEWLPVGLGWFVLDEWEQPGWEVDVSALDVRDTIRTAKLLAPSSPRPGATFRSELRALVGGRVPLNLDDAPADRGVPGGMAWSESRADAVDELLRAWPARQELDADGTMVVLPADLDERPADVTLVDGQGGTIIRRTRSGSRDGLYNVIVARGESPADPSSPAVSGYASDDDPASPTYVRGPMGELVDYFTSPLLTTNAQCKAAAQTVLRRSLRSSQQIPVQCLPDPRIGANTRVDLVDPATGTTTRTTVLQSRLPLTADGGAQQLVLGVIP